MKHRILKVTKLEEDLDLDEIDFGLKWLEIFRRKTKASENCHCCESCDKSLKESLQRHDYALPIQPKPEPIELSDDYVEVENLNVLIDCIRCGRRHTNSDRCCDTYEFKCATCKKTFKTRSCLERHVKIHTNEKKHFCDTCGKGFARRDVLRRHIRMHTGEKPYKCELCGKRFTDSGNLACHSKTHIEVRPHLCLTCGKSFKTKCYLIKHQRQHHFSNKET